MYGSILPDIRKFKIYTQLINIELINIAKIHFPYLYHCNVIGLGSLRPSAFVGPEYRFRSTLQKFLSVTHPVTESGF